MIDEEHKEKDCNILYELLVLSEWAENQNNILQKNSAGSTLKESTSYFNIWKLLKKPKLSLIRFLQTEYPWHLAVSKDGKVVAVLQETLLEIKTSKDEYSSVIGRAYVPCDQHPKLRKLSWSTDNSFLAIARDNGIIHVFNLLGSNVAIVEPEKIANDDFQPVVGLFFIAAKLNSTKWSNELLIVYNKGNIKSILLSSLDGYQLSENINYSLVKDYPQGISSAVYSSHHLLIIAGPVNEESGITVWRILNDYPFLKRSSDEETDTKNSRSLFRFLPRISNQISPKTIIKMIISPDGKLLACLHISGEISLWKIPGLVLHKKWSLKNQPEFNIKNPKSSGDTQNIENFHPNDICWWSSSALVIARRNGTLTVCSTSSLNNLLGDSPEFLSEFPQIFSIEGSRSGVIVLERVTPLTSNKNSTTNELAAEEDKETSVLQESIQAALYSFTDIERFEPKRKTAKVTQRMYRMTVLKQTTPEELYARKIDLEEYDEALLLAWKYNLDCDLVYQKRWRNNLVSKDNIHNYLEKVNKVLWVVNECVERVPDNFEDAKELLEFGLRKTDLKVTFKSLSLEEKELVIYRRKLLKFLDKLMIYKSVIESSNKYDGFEYDNFRRQSNLIATVNFARQENWHAVSVLLTYAGDEVLPHLLPILSNFPETLKPLHYRTLLPEIIQDNVIQWDTKKLRDLDWCEKSPYQTKVNGSNFEDDILYKDNPHLREFQASPVCPKVVKKWYKSRTYEIENNTGLVEQALSFVVLARERGIKNLDTMYNNLRTLECLVYLAGNLNINLRNLEALNHFEQCKLLLFKTTRTSFITDLKNLIVPFAKRCKEQCCHSAFSLLKAILLNLSERSLEYPLELLNYLKKGYLNPFSLSLNDMSAIVLDCIYTYPESDQLETCFLILECLPQREMNFSKEDMELHDRIDKLEIYLEICEILERYNTPKSVKFMYKNEGNEKIGKQLMENMAEFTKRETLNFTELLSDCLVIKSKIFSTIQETFCYELCALSQMTSDCESIEEAKNILTCQKSEKDKVIPFERSVGLVLQAARSHFEKANSFGDHYIKLSQTCLRIINEPNSEINEELDLIDALQLLEDFNVSILPLQVRKNVNRINLIQVCLETKSKNYKYWQKLLQLAHSLRIYQKDRTKTEGKVLMLIAEHALKLSDYQYCSEICNRLIIRNFTDAWYIIQLLARKRECGNNIDRLLYTAFAILHCPIQNMEELIEFRVELHQRNFPLLSGHRKDIKS